MVGNLTLYLFSFLGVWIGSGLTVKSVEIISKKLKISSFIASFVLLGLFTSIGEISVGINSLIKDDPEIFVGNLVGASIVIFMLIIPLLAITSRSIKITHEFRGFSLPASLVVAALPSISAMDGKITRIDGIMSIILFFFLLISIKKPKTISPKISQIKNQSAIFKQFLRMIFGITVIFVSSYFIVEQTTYFSQVLHISPFIISLLITSLGTNIPELSLIIRSAIMKDNEVAFGNYIGSASFNTLILGVLTLVHGHDIRLSNSYLTGLLFLVINLLLFFHFAKTKNTLSVKEGLILLSLYFIFLTTEIYQHLIIP